MKKILSFAIAFLLMTLISLPAFSADTTFEGEFRIRSYSEWNFEKKFNDIDDAQFDGWFEQRFRLKITHTRSEYLKAVVMLDLVEDTWGQGRAMRINNATATPHHVLWGPYAGEYINWAYLEFTLPTIGTFKVGKFPVKWGHGLMLSWGEDDEWYGPDGAEWSRDWGPISTTLLYYKSRDEVIYSGPTSPYYNRDRDFIGLHIGYSPAEDHLIELFGGYRHYHYQNQGFVSLAYTGNIADMIDLKFEAGVGFGRLSSSTTDKIFGYNIYFDASYYNDLFRVGLAFLMMSGREDADTSNMSHYAIGNFKWGNIIGNEGGLNSPYNAFLWYLSGPLMENITSVKLYFEIYPMDKLTINAAVIWARFTENVGSIASSAFYYHPALNYGFFSSGWAYDTPSKSRDLGWEVDLGFSYEIMEGLTFSFAGGVLFTGNAWDYDADGVMGAPYDRENWGEIWSIVNTLTYEF